MKSKVYKFKRKLTLHCQCAYGKKTVVRLVKTNWYVGGATQYDGWLGKKRGYWNHARDRAHADYHFKTTTKGMEYQTGDNKNWVKVSCPADWVKVGDCVMKLYLWLFYR